MAIFERHHYYVEGADGRAVEITPPIARTIEINKMLDTAIPLMQKGMELIGGGHDEGKSIFAKGKRMFDDAMKH